MKKNKVIVALLPFTKKQQDYMQKLAPDCHFHWVSKAELTDQLLNQAHVILGSISAAKFKAAARLEWLQLDSAGSDAYIAAGPAASGAALTNATGAYGPAIAEHLLAMLLFLQKKFFLYRDQQKQGLWLDQGEVTSITGSRALVVGLGDIGREFARRLQLLGSQVTAIKRTITAKPAFVTALHQPDDLDELLPQADIVALCLPGTAQTRQILNHRRLALLKKSAYLLNVGRGTAIDSRALVDLLQQGHLAGVGLDVTDPEPLPRDHPLWQMDNVLITPHVSGGFSLPATLERILGIALDNLARYLKDEPLHNLVDFKRGY